MVSVGDKARTGCVESTWLCRRDTQGCTQSVDVDSAGGEVGGVDEGTVVFDATLTDVGSSYSRLIDEVCS